MAGSVFLKKRVAKNLTQGTQKRNAKDEEFLTANERELRERIINHEDWKNTKTLLETDLPHVAHLLMKAYDPIAEQGNSETWPLASTPETRAFLAFEDHSFRPQPTPPGGRIGRFSLSPNRT